MAVANCTGRERRQRRDGNLRDAHPAVALDLLTVAVLAFVAVRLLTAARMAVRAPARSHIAFVLRGLRARHFLRAPVVFVAVIVVFALLYAVPPLRIGWWSLIGGSGTIVFGSTDRTAGSSLEWIIPGVFVVLLAPALVLFAQREEEIFRLGAEGWTTARRARRGVEFGLVHLIMGIPIAAALALSIGGWYFTWAYVRGYRRAGGDQQAALMESTRSHVAYNAEILALVLVSVVLTALT